jgi:hypothetical protein
MCFCERLFGKRQAAIEMRWRLGVGVARRLWRRSFDVWNGVAVLERGIVSRGCCDGGGAVKENDHHGRLVGVVGIGKSLRCVAVVVEGSQIVKHVEHLAVVESGIGKLSGT